jgi:hypothetical protein
VGTHVYTTWAWVSVAVQIFPRCGGAGLQSQHAYAQRAPCSESAKRPKQKAHRNLLNNSMVKILVLDRSRRYLFLDLSMGLLFDTRLTSYMVQGTMTLAQRLSQVCSNPPSHPKLCKHKYACCALLKKCMKYWGLGWKCRRVLESMPGWKGTYTR